MRESCWVEEFFLNFLHLALFKRTSRRSECDLQSHSFSPCFFSALANTDFFLPYFFSRRKKYLLKSVRTSFRSLAAAAACVHLSTEEEGVSEFRVFAGCGKKTTWQGIRQNCYMHTVFKKSESTHQRRATNTMNPMYHILHINTANAVVTSTCFPCQNFFLGNC